jgi:ethanolamine ammonia-lyase small subunit
MSRPPAPPAPDPWRFLERFTAARTVSAAPAKPDRRVREQLAHARARDAVHRALDAASVERELRENAWDVLRLHSAARDRTAYIQRPDLGRILSDASRIALESRPQPPAPFDVAFVVADGLGARRRATRVPPCADRPPLADAACASRDLRDRAGQGSRWRRIGALPRASPRC